MMNFGRGTSFVPLNNLQGINMMNSGGGTLGLSSPLNSNAGIGMMGLGGSNFDLNTSTINSVSPMMSGVGFNIANGQVTGMQQLIGSHMYNVSLPFNATFAVGSNNTVTETLMNGNATTMMQYTADSGTLDGYRLMSEIMSFANPTTSMGGNRIFGYSFSISNGGVTGMQEVLGTTAYTYTLNLPLPPTATFSVTGNAVSETLVQGNTIETRSFVAAGSNGLYALASDLKTFVQPGTATTLLSVEPYDRAKFAIDSSGQVTQMQAVRPDGSTVTLTPNSYTSLSQLAPGFVVETVSIGARSSYAVYHDGNADGIYTAVAHGTGTSVDLVGLHAQLTPAIEGVL